MKLISFTLIFLLSGTAYSINYTWNGSVSSDWDNQNNWTPSTGIPNATDNITIVSGPNNPALNSNTSIVDFTINSGTLNLNTHTITATGTCVLNGGTINNGSFTINTGLVTTLSTTTFGADTRLAVTSGRIFLNGGTYNGPVSLNQTGTNNTTCTGGATFNDSLTFTLSSTGRFFMQGGNTFNGPVHIIQNGGDIIRFEQTNGSVYNSTFTVSSNSNSPVQLAHGGNNFYFGEVYFNSTSGGTIEFCNTGGATAHLGPGTRMHIGGIGFNSGTLNLRRMSQLNATSQELTLGGTNTLFIISECTWSGNVSFTAPRITVTNNTFNGVAQLHKTHDNADLNNGGNTFNDSTYIVHSGFTNSFRMGRTAPDLFNGTLVLRNSNDAHIRMADFTTGNIINGNLIIENNSTDHVFFCNEGTSDLTVNGNIIISNNGASDVYFGNTGNPVTLADGYSVSAGALGITSGTIAFRNFIQLGNTQQNLTATGTAQIRSENSVWNGEVNFITPRIFTQNSTFNGITLLEKTGGTNDDSRGGNVFNQNATLINSGTARFWMCSNAADSPDIFNAITRLVNTGTSELGLANNAAGTEFNGDVVIECNNGNGIRFGQNGGSCTLAATRTVSIGATGFTAGNLTFRNFTQTGNTPQTLLTTGTTRFENNGSSWGGNVQFSGAQFYTHNTSYGGTAYLEKYSSTDDISNGGNTFDGDAELRNSGSGYFLMGNVNPDIFNANLVMNNTGTYRMYLSNNAAGTTVAGNLTINNTASGTTDNNIYIAFSAPSSVNVAGNLTVINNSTTTGTADVNIASNGSVTIQGDANLQNIGNTDFCRIYFATNSGNVTVNGTVLGNNNNTSTTGRIILAGDAGSNVVINGAATFINAGAQTNKQVYLGNNGSVNFGSTLTIENTATATNSEVFCNHSATSSGTYNGNIVLTNTGGVASGGVRFGQSGGTGTLAATRTVSIGAAGFTAGNLTFQNFTQVGPTAQILLTTGTTRFENNSSSWGGNVQFSGAQFYTHNTFYGGIAYLEKYSSTDDVSNGGNTFVGDAELKNSGSGYFLMGNVNPDIFNANLVMNNTGTYRMYLSNRAAGTSVAGNLTINNTAGGTTDNNIYICNNVGSSVNVTGNVSIINNSSASTSANVFLGDNGSVSITGNLDIQNIGTANILRVFLANQNNGFVNVGGSLNAVNSNASTTGEIYLANGATNSVTIGGNSTFINSGAQVTKRLYLGNGGNVTFTGDLVIDNSATATNSEVYCNNNATSTGIYNGNITVTSTGGVATSGVRFGQNGGSATLAATRTINIGAAGFSSGNLRFRNFTQVGSTDQTLHPTATAYFLSLESNWGGNVSFIAPRVFLRGNTFNGTAYIEKSGALDDDSRGGNLFQQNATLVNSGTSRLWMCSNAADAPDIFNGNTNLRNTGTSEIRMANNAAGTQFNGNLTVESTSGNGIRIGQDGGSAVMAAGFNVSLGGLGFNSGELRFRNVTQNGNTASNLILTGTGYFISQTSNWGGNFSITAPRVFLSGNRFNGISYFEKTGGTDDNSRGNNVFEQTATLVNSGTALLRMCSNAADNPDIFNGNTILINTGSSQLRLANNAPGTQFNGNISVECNSGSGIRFGEEGGSSTLASGGVISIGTLGFSAGELRFRNFTQLGTTTHNLTCTGTTTMFDSYNSVWNGPLSVSTPRLFLRESTFNNTLTAQKTGAGNDHSFGGNTFHSATIISNSGSDRLRLATNQADIFIGNITFTKTGTGDLQPAYNRECFFSANISVNANSIIRMAEDVSGRVTMNGNNNQIFSTGPGTPRPEIRRWTINKTGGNITLSSPLAINNQINLSNGVIFNQASSLLWILNGATVINTSHNSYVNGPVRKVGNQAFVFPVGKNGLYRPISISAPNNNTHHFTAEYFANFASNDGYDHAKVQDPSIKYISHCEYWILDRTNGNSNVTVSLSYFQQDADPFTCSGIGDTSTLAVMRWNGTEWINHGKGTVSGTLTEGTVPSAAAITSFSPFTLGTLTEDNTLPLNLIEFTYQFVKEEVSLNWKTANEYATQKFIVEKSSNGTDWYAIGEVMNNPNNSGAGKYSFTDIHFSDGTAYYRLLQIDVDGNTKIYGPLAVRSTANKNEAGYEISFYPNPAKELLQISTNTKTTVNIQNLLGQTLQYISLTPGINTVNITSLPAGTYIIECHNSAGRKIFVKE